MEETYRLGRRRAGLGRDAGGGEGDWVGNMLLRWRVTTLTSQTLHSVT